MFKVSLFQICSFLCFFDIFHSIHLTLYSASAAFSVLLVQTQNKEVKYQDEKKERDKVLEKRSRIKKNHINSHP